MKIIIFLILPILIALTWKYISIASETLRQLQQGKEPEIDPMQSAILPEIIVMLILSPIFYLVVKLFDPINSIKFMAWGQLALVTLMVPFVAKFWWGLKQFKP